MPFGHGRPPSAKVLVIDDDDTFRHSVARVLTGHGYQVRQAPTGTAARAVLDAETDISAVLCDIRMPGESGLDVIGRLADDHPDLAIVMTTGIDDPEVAATAFDIGADGYLIKPITPNELRITLANALKRREMEVSRRAYLRGVEGHAARLQHLTTTLHGIRSAESALDEADTVDRLSQALSLRDEETGSHIQRMSRYAAMLADTVGYRTHGLEEVRMATALHDVGKIGVPDTVLLKAGPLSPDERTAMQRHPSIGYQLLAGSSSTVLEAAAVIALNHHERWDGGGYPQGLQGQDIPEIARIAAVTDVFDALVSNRVYRPGLPIEEAVSILCEARGLQFEPRLVDAFLDLIDDTAAIRDAYPDHLDDTRRIRVLVVDDHEVFVQSLVRLLSTQPGIKVIGTAASVDAAVHAATAYTPDVILMDVELPDGDGITATNRIRLLVPGAKVVMLTGRIDEQTFARAIAAGCAGFVTKTRAVETLLEAIQAAHEGEFLTGVPELAQLLHRLPPTSRGLGADLRPRELEVLRLVAGGLPNKLVARQLHISVHTVRGHVQSILAKLNAHSRLEAVATAVREGIIGWDEQQASG